MSKTIKLKKVHVTFSEYPQRLQTIESLSSLRGTVIPSMKHLGHLVKPLIFYQNTSKGQG